MMCLMQLAVQRGLIVLLRQALSRLRVMDDSLFLKCFRLTDVESECENAKWCVDLHQDGCATEVGSFSPV